jgi:hypothetical protein
LARAILESPSAGRGASSSQPHSALHRSPIQPELHPNSSEGAPISPPSEHALPSEDASHVVSTADLQEPIWTAAGRSGFFATPDPRPSFEVRLRAMHPHLQVEYDRASETSETRSQAQRSATSTSVPLAAENQDDNSGRKPTPPPAARFPVIPLPDRGSGALLAETR